MSLIRRTMSTFVLLVALSCSKSSFQGQNSDDEATSEPNSQNQTQATASPSPLLSEQSSGCDYDKDQVNLKFPTNIQQCVDAGNIWNFERRECSPVQRASYECSFDGIIARADGELGIGIESVMRDLQAANAKLVACGEMQNRDILLIQGWYPTGEAEECEYNPSMTIFVNCYQLWGPGEKPNGWDALSKEERVTRCLTNNYDLSTSP